MAGKKSCRNLSSKIYFIAYDFWHRYKDIGELMRRCETLIATRDNLMKTRDRIRATISEEQDGLAAFKEEQNERILELR